MNALIGGKKVPYNLLGKLKKSSHSNSKDTDFSDKLEGDGYLFIPNAIDVSEIKTARNDIFKKLNEIDELEDPYNEGIFSGKSIRDKIHSDRGVFWESVSSGESLRSITNGKNLEAIFSKIFKEPAIGFDFISLTSFKHRSVGKQAHLSFLNPEKPITVIEDMHLEKLDSCPSKINVFPLLVKNIDSAPVNVIAIN